MTPSPETALAQLRESMADACMTLDAIMRLPRRRQSLLGASLRQQLEAIAAAITRLRPFLP
jgi:hypothetical protein